MAWDDISDLTWLHPRETPGQALAQGVQAGSSIASNWLRGKALSQEREQFNAQLAERRRQFELALPVRLASEEARRNYQETALANALMKIKSQDDQAYDTGLLTATVMSANEASKKNGADGIMSTQPKEPFRTFKGYKTYTDWQISTAKELRSTDEAKQYEKLSRVEQMAIQTINDGDGTPLEKAIGIDAIMSAAKEREAKLKVSGTTSATPGSIVYDKATGKQVFTVPVTETQTTTEIFPEVEAKPAIPGKPAEKNWLSKDKKATPEVSAVPYQPKRTVAKRTAVKPAISKAASPSEKAALANKLQSEHPDWTREQIISEVNK